MGSRVELFAAIRRGSHAGTRVLIEVLLHRRMARPHLLAGLTATPAAGSVSPDLVAVEARKAAVGAPVAARPTGHPQ